MKNCLDSDWLRAVQFLVDKVKKTRKKFLLKCCEWQCTETMQFCLSIKCEICFHVHRRWFYFAYCLWLEKAKSLICFTWILRRQHLKHTRHHCMEYDQALFHLSNNEDSRYVLLSKFCMLSAIVLLGWRCEKWTNLVLTGTENNRAISFIQKCPRGM